LAHILFLTQVLPYPLDAGPKVRAYHMLRYLASCHDVTLVSFVRADDPPAAIEHLQSVCGAVHVAPMRRSGWRNLRAVARGLLTGLPIVVARDEIPEMSAIIRRLAASERFDVVHADQLSMASWGRCAVRVAENSGHQPRSLLDEHNAIYMLSERMAAEAVGIRRWAIRREAKAFRRYEAGMVRAFDALLTVTDEDRTHLLAIFDERERRALASKFTVVPICVDPEQVRPVPWRAAIDYQVPSDRNSGGKPQTSGPLSDPPGRESLPRTILHLGTMFWPPNVNGVLWFTRNVLPIIHRDVPTARFVIAGKNPPAEIQALAADPRVEVTGYVPDPMPYLEATDVFVVPLHAGGGMRVKILDAWLWGLPVVSTSIGAEGIALRDGENILLADDPQAFAAACVRLLTDPALNLRLGAAGRRWVEERYGWQAVYRRVDDVYARLLQSGG
jgi:polysaccharide biosynthesis protein PslH